MQSVFFLFFVPAALTQLLSPPDLLPCPSQPIASIYAGGNIDFRLFQQDPCEATVSFANASFAPVTLFAQAIDCIGDNVAEITIPRSAPNGIMSVTWQCRPSFTSSCSIFNVVNGTGEISTFNYNSIALSVNCRSADSLDQSTCPSSSSSCRHCTGSPLTHHANEQAASTATTLALTVDQAKMTGTSLAIPTKQVDVTGISLTPSVNQKAETTEASGDNSTASTTATTWTTITASSTVTVGPVS